MQMKEKRIPDKAALLKPRKSIRGDQKESFEVSEPSFIKQQPIQ